MTRILAACAIAAGLLTAAAPAATAAISVPFQINPAAFGNPHGSFDLPPFHCVAVVAEQPGRVRISGGSPDGWGCLIYSEVNWLNLSTGATGVTWMSDGLGGFPAETTMATGAGHVLLALRPTVGNITPGIAAFHVP